MESLARKSIRHCLEMLAPFEAPSSSPYEACEQFSLFMRGIYKDMHQKPETFFVFTKAYDNYIANKMLQPAITPEKKHATDSRESTLRNAVQQQIQFYAVFLYHLGCRCVLPISADGSLLICKNDYFNILETMNKFGSCEHNEARYQLLRMRGLTISDIGDHYCISHSSYPLAMIGLTYLCQAPDSKYKFMNYLRLDFKNAYNPSPLTADVIMNLPSDKADVVRLLEKNLQGLHIKARVKPLRGIVSDFHWKVEYSLGGKNICGFYADADYLMICIYFNDFKNISNFADILYDSYPNLFTWYKAQFPERLCKCPSNRMVHFKDEKRRICGFSNRTETLNPSSADVSNCIQILRMYRNLTS